MVRELVLLVVGGMNILASQNLDGQAPSVWKTPTNNIYGYSCIKLGTDSTYIELVSGVKGQVFGTYLLTRDTLILFQERGEYDSEFPINSSHRTGKMITKFLLRDNRLMPFFRWRSKARGRINPQTIFDKDYFFQPDTACECR